MIVKSCTLIIFILGKLKRDSTIDKQSPYKDFTLAESFSILSLAEILQLRSGYYLSCIEARREKENELFAVFHNSTRQLDLYYKISFLNSIYILTKG